MTKLDIWKHVSDAQEIAKTDLAAALAFVRLAVGEAGYMPVGAINEARFLFALERREEAAAIIAGLKETSPGAPLLWSLLLDFNRNTAEFNEACRFVFEAMKKIPAIDAEWTLHIFFRVALAILPDDTELAEVRWQATAGKSRTIALTDAIHFLDRIVRSIPDKGKLATIPDQWRFAIADRDMALATDGSRWLLNLATFDVQSLDGWELGLAKLVVSAIREHLGCHTYNVDYGISMWPRACECSDRQMLLWCLLDAAAALTPDRGSMMGWIYGVERPLAEIRPGELWVRPGLVEHAALWNYANDRQAALRDAECVATQALEADGPGLGSLTGQAEWWPRIDGRKNIAKLCTNAGWYAKPGHAAAAFEDWCLRYRDALARGNQFVVGMAESCRVAQKVPAIGYRPPFAFSEESLFATLGGARIIFVSAYADAIQSHYDSGKLLQFWHDLGLTHAPRSVKTVKAPMSVWPYRPADSWTESFEQLMRDVRAEVAGQEATVFLASCGCYGLPVCDAVHRECGITSIYFGHVVNTYFGVRTGDLKNSPHFNRFATSPHWLDGNLSRTYPETGRIDDGRYS
jgi:hypothetical protein